MASTPSTRVGRATRRVPPALAAAGLLLAGCAGDGGLSPLWMAEQLDCSESMRLVDAPPPATSAATCALPPGGPVEVPGRPLVVLLTFPDGEASRALVEDAVGEGRAFAVGDGWAVEVPSPATAQDVTRVLGGSAASDT